ncbi:hypothetical protein ACIPWL_09515 [Streptomyces sp. NPDC090023]|uniref:hypothetical protein n=1 Tax=unclassified Streptomyces TaxID=2593676 RepID=UPI0037FE6AD2
MDAMVLDGTITDPNTMDRDEVFRAALDAVLMKAAEIDPVVRRSIKWSMKYGRKRRARTAQHNERSILKKLGTGFRLLSNAVTVAEDVHRDLFRSFGQKLAEDGLSRDSVIAAPGVIGGVRATCFGDLGVARARLFDRFRGGLAGAQGI